MVSFLGLERGRRTEDRLEMQVEGAQHEAMALDGHIFLLPLLNFILKFSSSESTAKHIHPHFSRADFPPGAYHPSMTSPALEAQILILDPVYVASCSFLCSYPFQNDKPRGEMQR